MRQLKRYVNMAGVGLGLLLLLILGGCKSSKQVGTVAPGVAKAKQVFLQAMEEQALHYQTLTARLGVEINLPNLQVNSTRVDLKMIKDSAAKKFDVVIVWKLDRFSRNRVDSAHYKYVLRKNGVKVISATESISEGSEGILLESVLEGIAEYYSAELSQKVLRGLNENRKKGLFCGGGVPYGYRVENKRVYVDEDAAEIVRYIYERYSIGVTVPQILKELNARNVLFKGRAFNSGHVYKILSNERYSGKYTVHGETYTNTFPKIVSDEIFDRVAQTAKKNLRCKRSVEVVYLLKNKVKCGYCGMPVTAETGTSRHGKTIHYYKCSGRKRNITDCDLMIVRKETLEKIVMDAIINALSEPNAISKIVDHIYQVQEQMLNEQKELKLLQSEKQKIDLAIDNIMSAIERGVMSNNAIRRLNELEEQQLEYEKKIAIEKSKTVDLIPKAEIANYYKSALKLEPLLLINYLVDEIILYNDRIEIRFTSPITKSPDDCQGFLLYSNSTTISCYDKITGLFVNEPFYCIVKL